ncbi:hypothetical protein Tco_1130421, partial [Tanacetum coccineum]
MDWYTTNTLWVYWMRGDDEVVLRNEEVSDLNDENNDDEQEIGEIFRTKTNLFDYEIPFTWMAFGGNTRDLGSFGEETDKIKDLHQIHEEVLFTKRGDGVAGIKQCRRDLS